MTPQCKALSSSGQFIILPLSACAKGSENQAEVKSLFSGDQVEPMHPVIHTLLQY